MAGSVQRTVTTAATLLDVDTVLSSSRSVLIRNRGSVAVFIGGSAVTTGTGFQLDPGETVTLDTSGTGAGVATYGITASGSSAVHVLQA